MTSSDQVHNAPSTETPLKSGNTYAIITVVCCFLALMVNLGFVSTAFGVFQPHIVAMPGVGDSGGTIVISVRMLVTMILLLVTDRYLMIFGCRSGLALGCVFTALGFFIYSQADSLALLCVGSVFTGAGYAFGGMVGTTLLVNKWFKTNIATAVSICAVGSGVAAILVPIVATRMIQSYSLQMAFLLEGSAALILAAILYTSLRNDPADLGMRPFELAGKGKDTRDAAAQDDASDAISGIPTAPMTPAMVVAMLVACVFVGGFSAPSGNYLSVLLSSQGFDITFIAKMLATFGVCITLSKLLSGPLFDRIGTVRGTLVIAIIEILGFIGLCLSSLQIDMLVLCAVVFNGLGASLASVGIPVWSIELSSVQECARNVKNFQVAYSVGGFLFNLFPGPLKDLTGTYIVSYAIFMIICILTAIIVIRVYRLRRPDIR